MTISKEALLGQKFGISSVEIPGIGTVKVRPLTRAEAIPFHGVETDYLELERKLLSIAMVEPSLTEDEVKTWQEVSPAGQLEVIVDRITEISGMKKDSAKTATKSVH